ncbi:bifunctional DNA-formamidopyrimidine glycosylase/DNA-(apurinic or apyrimidinic site) lyase [Fretibacter rubidus]|uniref:bifunctional DNA-formamidopyrimidine glycosylase/DNA-(apurinic or apyrimidinic site) lyase n=1 Tax=Fretibacter rubidus TaxID=570162 RepID=UPI00352A15CD
MPELPEVETVRRGLAPVMDGAVFSRVTLNRADLRFPFAERFAQRLTGATVNSLTRRAKFLQAELSTGERLFMHLGMSGRFTIEADVNNTPGVFTHQAGDTNPKHDHVVFEFNNGARVTYNDPRRFGFMELIASGAPYRLDGIGPEPLGNDFSAPVLRTALKGKKSKIKAALLDQHVVAGLGNIYVCEALYKAGISPKRAAGRLTVAETERLVGHIKEVLNRAIAAGGSSLNDFASTDGALGYFQHSFDVYGREGEACKACTAPIVRIVQSGRSSFYCKSCQG